LRRHAGSCACRLDTPHCRSAEKESSFRKSSLARPRPRLSMRPPGISAAERARLFERAQPCYVVCPPRTSLPLPFPHTYVSVPMAPHSKVATCNLLGTSGLISLVRACSSCGTSRFCAIDGRGQMGTKKAKPQAEEARCLIAGGATNREAWEAAAVRFPKKPHPHPKNDTARAPRVCTPPGVSTPRLNAARRRRRKAWDRPSRARFRPAPAYGRLWRSWKIRTPKHEPA
jgi:hypothetical protein